MSCSRFSMNGSPCSAWYSSRTASTAPNFSTAWRRASDGRHAGAKILLRLQREMLLHLFPQPPVVSPAR